VSTTSSKIDKPGDCRQCLVKLLLKMRGWFRNTVLGVYRKLRKEKVAETLPWNISFTTYTVRRCKLCSAVQGTFKKYTEDTKYKIQNSIFKIFLEGTFAFTRSFACLCILHNNITVIKVIILPTTEVCLFMTDQKLLILQQIIASNFLFWCVRYFYSHWLSYLGEKCLAKISSLSSI